jgi:hypothetical protein
MPRMTDWLVVLLVTPALSICHGCWANFQCQHSFSLQGCHGDDHHKQFQETIPLFVVHSIMFSVEQCLYVSHYCLFFWFSATKDLGHPIRDASAITAITCSTVVQDK